MSNDLNRVDVAREALWNELVRQLPIENYEHIDFYAVYVDADANDGKEHSQRLNVNDLGNAVVQALSKK